jgi:hypothetical protein
MSAIDPRHIVNSERAKALYLDNLKPEEALADWHFAIREARKLAAGTLRASAFLTNIAGALQKNGGHSLVFRQLLAPPLSQDQFKLLCPLWTKQSENKCSPLSVADAKAAEAVILARLDHGLVQWMGAGRKPSHHNLRIFLKVVAALMALQKVSTARRKRLAFEQEYAVMHLLEAEGWTKLPSKLTDTGAAVPFRSFMHKTRFATGTTTHQEVDIACGLKGTYVLAMECKVTNDETNSVKRINDVLKKATAWKDHWGNFIVTAALLQGVVAPKDVQRLSDAKIEVFWSHDLNSFRQWLALKTQT